MYLNRPRRSAESLRSDQSGLQSVLRRFHNTRSHFGEAHPRTDERSGSANRAKGGEIIRLSESLNVRLRPARSLQNKNSGIDRGRAPQLKRRACGFAWRSFGRRLVDVNSAVDIPRLGFTAW